MATATEGMEVTKEVEDGPFEDWTKKEWAEERNTLGLSDEGNKGALVERSKEARVTKSEDSTPEAATVESPAEEVAAEEEPSVD